MILKRAKVEKGVDVLYSYLKDYVTRYQFIGLSKISPTFFTYHLGINRNETHYHSHEYNSIFFAKFETDYIECYDLDKAVASVLSISQENISEAPPSLSIWFSESPSFLEDICNRPLFISMDIDIDTNKYDINEIGSDSDVFYNAFLCMIEYTTDLHHCIANIPLSKYPLCLRPILQAKKMTSNDLIEKLHRDVKTSLSFAGKDNLYDTFKNITKSIASVDLHHKIIDIMTRNIAFNRFVIQIGQLTISLKPLVVAWCEYRNKKRANILSINLANFFTNVLTPASIYNIDAIFDKYVYFDADVFWLSATTKKSIYGIRPIIDNFLNLRIKSDSIKISLNIGILRLMSTPRMINYILSIQKQFIKEFINIHRQASVLIIILPSVSL